MKEYRLLAWPDLPAEYRRTGHLRALTELSMRYLSLPQLVEVSSLRKAEIRNLVELLDGLGLLAERDTSAPDSFFDSFLPLSWLRRGKKAEQREPG